MASKKLVVTSYSSDPFHPGLLHLYRSMAQWRWPRLRIWTGEDHYNGHNWKLEVFKATIPLLRMDGASHAILVDSWDSFFVNSIDFVLPHCGDGALISAERACYPHPDKAALYPPEMQHSDWKYVNGGGLLTNLDYFENAIWPEYLLRKLDNDQVLFTDLLVDRVPGFELDSRCQVFQSIAFCEMDRDFEKFPDGKVKNKQTNTLPVVLHANGRSDFDWFIPGWRRWWE